MLTTRWKKRLWAVDDQSQANSGLNALVKELLKKISEIPATLDSDAFGRISGYPPGESAMTEGRAADELYRPSIERYHGSGVPRSALGLGCASNELLANVI